MGQNFSNVHMYMYYGLLSTAYELVWLTLIKASFDEHD